MKTQGDFGFGEIFPSRNRRQRIAAPCRADDPPLLRLSRAGRLNRRFGLRRRAAPRAAASGRLQKLHLHRHGSEAALGGVRQQRHGARIGLDGVHVHIRPGVRDAHGEDAEIGADIEKRRLRGQAGEDGETAPGAARPGAFPVR